MLTLKAEGRMESPLLACGGIYMYIEMIMQRVIKGIPAEVFLN